MSATPAQSNKLREFHTIETKTGIFSDWDSFQWTLVHDFDVIREEWHELQQTAISTPFQSIDWVEIWYNTIGREKGYTPQIITVRKSGQLIMLLPLVVHRYFGLNRLTWMGGIWNDYNTPIIDLSAYHRLTQIDITAIWRNIGILVREADFISLPKQPHTLAGRLNPFVLDGFCQESDGTHYMELGQDWDTFQNNKWSKSTLRRLRQKRNQLKRMGILRYRQFEDGNDKREAVNLILTWKSDQLRQRGSNDPFNDGAFADFIENAARSSPKLQVHALELDDRIIAGVISFSDPESLLIYQMAFDPFYNRQSPGRLLLDDMMQFQIRQGHNKLDFGYGDEPYKMKLADESIILLRNLIGLKIAGKIACQFEKTKVQAITFLKSNPRFRELYHSIKSLPLPGNHSRR